jgi:hypothetical protein
MLNSGEDYIIYQPVSYERRRSSSLVREQSKLTKKTGIVRSDPETNSFTVFLKKGRYNLEWFDPLDESLSIESIRIENDGRINFTKPSHIKNDAVLYLKKTEEKPDNQAQEFAE